MKKKIRFIKYFFIISLFCLFIVINTEKLDIKAQNLSVSNPKITNNINENKEIIKTILNKISISEELKNNNQFEYIVDNVYNDILSNPHLEVPYNSDVLIDIYTQIKNILCKEKISTSNISTKWNGNYKLQQNVVHGEWTDDYEFYNCYAYAIGKTEKDYNYTYQYQPGDFVKDGREYLRNVFTIDGLANLVKDDLETLGYKVNISLNQPLFINDDQELIALRNIYHWDYHFMRYDKNDRQWYHKPGNTAILRYLHHPSDLLWLQEFYTLKDGPETTGEYYDSDVYYITFTKNYYSNNNVSFSIVDQEITIDKIDGYLEYDIHLLSPIYYEHNVYNVTKIQANSFKDQTRLQSINIPSSINYIGSCAFENTNNAEIYFNKINSIPKIFSERWNISKNPVYLDMDLCTHEIKNNKYNDSTHKSICERCQTMLKEEAHNYIDLICHLRCTDCEHKKVIKHNLSYTKEFPILDTIFSG